MAHTGRPAYLVESTPSTGVDAARREYASTSPNAATQDTTIEMTPTTAKHSMLATFLRSVTANSKWENTGKAS